MIRGYITFVTGDAPVIPHVVPASCRETIRLIENNFEFFISIANEHYFKLLRNVRTVDKRNIGNGIVCIGFIRPDLSITIFGNPRDLQAFVHTVEGVKNLEVPPPKCSDRTHEEKLECICKGPRFRKFRFNHITNYGCPVAVSPDELCTFCCYRVLERYNDSDAFKILETWKLKIKTAGQQRRIRNISVDSYPYLRTLQAYGNGLEEIPEALGLLPCLTHVNLIANRLAQATNWNWLSSPFARENLRQLWLGSNELSNLPNTIVGLRNLELLDLSENCLTELPDALGKLKNLSCLHIDVNNLEMLPAWIYRKERLFILTIQGNDAFISDEYRRPHLNPEDFHVIPVPSLLQTVAKYIVINRIAFWEHNIPAALADYLEEAYYCRCGSVIFRDTIGLTVHCRIKTDVLAATYDWLTVPVAIRCCSYECYRLFEPYTMISIYNDNGIVL